jgi:short-subunit dehydrogenase/acyl carrier protein
MARWMVEKGARHLILVGRSGASSAISSQLRELEQAGAEVVVAKADVSELEQVAQVLKEIVQSQPPLRGIIHAVGVLDDGILRQQNWERFAKVMNPKVAGAWNLHTLTQHLPLDFFVMFSSVVSLLGNGGQANHAAANAFLDALAYYRQAQGLPGLSINWGPWSDIGAAAKRQVGHRMSTTGMGTISPQQGLQAMEELLRRDAAQVGVMPVNWFEFLDQFPANTYPALFSDLADQVRQKKVEQKQGSDTNLKDQLNEASSDERRKLLVEYLQQQVKKLLGFDASSPLESNQLLSELGLDSLVSIQLRNRLRTELNVDLPIDKFLESTIVQLGNALLEKLALANIILSEAPSTDLGEDMEEITL